MFWVLDLMIKLALRRLRKTDVAGPLLLRAAVVGLNFCVMVWLSFQLGLGAFGALIYLWGGALITSAIVSCGGPLVLLRALCDGSGLRLSQIIGLTAVLPSLICGVGWFATSSAMPDDRWATLFAVALSANAVSCLASIMRAMGSVQSSMLLRDAGPFTALGVAALLQPTGDAKALLWIAAALMCLMVAAATLWCVMHRGALAKPAGNHGKWLSLPLWGTSILGMLMAQVDLIIGGTFMNAEALGLYALLRRIANVVALPVTVATWVSAKPVAAAYGAGDLIALEQASAKGSQIAWYPALCIAAVCLCGLAISATSPLLIVTSQIATCFGILLFGALVQAFLASGFTVATLSKYAALSVIARAATISSYLCFTAFLGVDMSPISNAIGFTVAMCLGSGLVWVVLLQRLGIDTSACVLWRREVPAWRTS